MFLLLTNIRKHKDVSMHLSFKFYDDLEGGKRKQFFIFCTRSKTHPRRDLIEGLQQLAVGSELLIVQPLDDSRFYAPLEH